MDSLGIDTASPQHVRDPRDDVRPAGRGAADRPEHFGFLLLPEFTHLALSCAIEPLRIANLISARELYEWTLVAPDRQTQTASCGIEVSVASPGPPSGNIDRLYVVSGSNVARHVDARILDYLRRASRHGTPLGGICSGGYVLASAGFMDGLECAIHWAFHDGFEEAFPNARLSRSVFVANEPIVTAAGGPAAADLMLHLIAEKHGPQLAQLVADQMVYAGARDERASQRLSFSARYATRSKPLSRALSIMEDNLEMPLSCAKIAMECGVTIRQLQRLFLKFVGRSPCKVYHELRLHRAQALLRQTDMSIIEVALACGFQSPSSFSRNYRKLFGRRPSVEALA